MMSSRRYESSAVQFAPNDTVITPSGRLAQVIDIYPDVDEVLVQWPNGDRARFRSKLLRKAP